MELAVIGYLVGVVVLLYLIYQRCQQFHLARAIKKDCASCRSVAIEDGVLSGEECSNILQGDRVGLKKLGGKTRVMKRVVGDIESGPYQELLFLTDDYTGGEVHSDGQIIYPVVGRKLKGKILLQPVRSGEQWVVAVGS